MQMPDESRDTAVSTPSQMLLCDKKFINLY